MKNKTSKIKDKFVRVDKNNIGFLSAAMPRACPVIKMQHWHNANKFVTCIQLHDFPEESRPYIMTNLINNHNVMVMLDFENIPEADVETIFSKHIEAKRDDSQLTNKVMKAFQNQRKINQLLEYQSYVQATKDGSVSLSVRLYLYEDSIEKLEKLIQEIMSKLQSMKFGGYIQANDLARDFKALTAFDDSIKEIVPSQFMADAMMYNDLSRVDEKVSLMGYTASGGAYAVDNFNFRYSSFNRILSGMTGSGKSALVKLHSEDMVLKHEKVFKLDYHNEYDALYEQYDLSSISFNEKMYLNICQIFHVADTINGIIKITDITDRISLISSIVAEQAKFPKESIIKQLRKSLNNLFKQFEGKNLMSIKNDEWFVLGDVLRKVNERKGNETELQAKDDLYQLELGLEDMIDTYGHLYNHHTNVEIDLSKSIRFDLSFMENEKNRYVKSAYLTLMASYLMQAMYLNEKENYRLMEEKGVSLYELDRPLMPMKITIDEFDSYFWCRGFLQTVYDMLTLARKSFVCVELVIHGIDGILDSKNKENADLLMDIVNLCCMKYIGKTDGVKDGFSKIVEGVTINDMINVSKFNKGDKDQRRFLVIDERKEKMIFTSLINDRQKVYFKGGR